MCLQLLFHSESKSAYLYSYSGSHLRVSLSKHLSEQSSRSLADDANTEVSLSGKLVRSLQVANSSLGINRPELPKVY